MIKIVPDSKNFQSFILIDKSLLKFRTGIRQGLFEIGAENVKHLRLLLKDRSKKTGRWYFYKRHGSHGGGFWYQASAPGEAPAKRSGLLMRTTHYQVSGSDQVEFGDKQDYGLKLEIGSKNVAPRPHVGRTAKEKEKDNYNSITHSVFDQLRRNTP